MAIKVPLPIVVGEVTVAVYVPLLLSVTAPMEPVPDNLVMVTVEPPVPIKFPKTSRAVTVNTWVDNPFAIIVEGDGVNVDLAASGKGSPTM